MTPRTHVYLSPAKINWFLHITGRRADGYHTLETVFQRIDWCDKIDISVHAEGEIRLTDSICSIPNEQNLILKAAQALKRHAHEIGHNVDSLGSNIHLQKNIPMGAGLGGGSSNAATTLLALNELWQLNIDNASLQNIGLALGADVPFFVSPYSGALARGVGEELTPLDLPKRDLLLVKPNVHADTRSVYQHELLIRNHAPLTQSSAELQNQLAQLQANSKLTNDMQPAAFAIAPEIEQVHSSLCAAVPNAYVRMSGSGATIFACPRNDVELEALKVWQAQCPEQWVSRWCETLA